ncbi:MAG TPA: glycosyltransferase [Bradyrhizobium sp.]|nr:glycosyltransferase [Bradyrhizobium sp.]
MNPDALTYFELMAPLAFVFGAIYLLGPMLPLSRPWARMLVFAAVWLVIARYLEWRLFETVMPAGGEWYEVGWVWFCFAVEVLALFDALILYLAFLRVSDRHAEADAHEARLRLLPPEATPSVDLYIPTYNESLEVLEKTITGALCLEYPNFKIWVLDDGRRPWLKAFCEAKGVGYLTRPDNAHAKAGNINHALTKTNADFVAIFDADFIPQRNFLIRTMGFFEDPRVGIVQVPHAFYNYDPTQSSLALQKALPDDQRFFFEAVMPSRDGWDAAFCCGSNSVTRREALRSVGDALPTDSITEDMLLSIALLRNGYITRYLCERLAFGLAPEGLKAFFVQRKRWARGAMQILYLAAGPLGRNLSLMQRLLFLPTHWLSQGLMLLLTLVAPLVFLWTGILPLVHVTPEAVLYYLLPMILAVAGGIWAFAPRHYFPFAAQVHGTFQSFKVLPTVLVTMAKPFGHVFKVTPKGAEAKTSDYDRPIFWTAACLMLLTILGLVINSQSEWRIIGEGGLLPIVACWAVLNIVVLFLVCMMSLQAPVRRGEERFDLDEPVWIFAANGALSTGRIRDISLSGAAIIADENRALATHSGERARIFITEVGFVAASVVRQAGQFLAVHFDLPPGVERDLLVRRLFTAGLDATTVHASALSSTAAMLMSIWAMGTTRSNVEAPAPASPLAAVEKLPAQSLVVPSRQQPKRLGTIAAERKIAA